MRKVKVKGQNVEEAVQAGLAELGILKEQASIVVIDKGKKGFLGLFGSRPAIVEVEKIADPIEEAAAFFKKVAVEMGIEVEIDIIQKGKNVDFTLKGSEIGKLIGKRGQTLNALQLLTQLVANRYSNQYINITLNPEGYRSRRKETLENLAKRLAAQVSKTSKSLLLEPMPSHERKIIHQALVKHPSVKTTSVGEGPKRRIKIEPLSRP